MVVFVADRNGPLRHLGGAIRTALWLVANRPRTVWFQYSFALAAVLAAYRTLSPWRVASLVADVHTKALRRDGGTALRWIVSPIKKWTMRSCDVAIVTNEENRRYAQAEFAVDPVVLTDPMPVAPRLPPAADTDENETPIVVFVCSYAEDEPLGLIRAVAELLAPRFRCVVTGDPSRLPAAERERLASAADMSGFLATPDYWALLAKAAAIVVPTTQPACLPCGAYEALAVGRRPVLLDDEVARGVFGDLAAFSAPAPDPLATAVVDVVGARGRPKEEGLARLRESWEQSWQELLLRTGAERP